MATAAPLMASLSDSLLTRLGAAPEKAGESGGGGGGGGGARLS